MGNLSEQTSIQFALTIDNIWSLRNKVINNDFKFNILTIIKNLKLRIQEHIQALEDPAANSVEKEKKCHIWEASALDTIKLNVDVATYSNSAAIAVEARDHQGTLLKAWCKPTNHLDPTITEAKAVPWDLELAISERRPKIIVESDGKNCINALSGPINDSC